MNLLRPLLLLVFVATFVSILVAMSLSTDAITDSMQQSGEPVIAALPIPVDSSHAIAVEDADSSSSSSASGYYPAGVELPLPAKVRYNHTQHMMVSDVDNGLDSHVTLTELPRVATWTTKPQRSLGSVTLEAHPWLRTIDATMSVTGDPIAAEPGLSRIMCLIAGTKARVTRLVALRDTWLSRCDGHAVFVAVSDAADVQQAVGPAVRVVGLSFEGEEKYTNMWHKSRAMWLTTFDTLIDPNEPAYDYFLWSGDDTFLQFDHLRSYLHTEAIKELQLGGEPLYLGHRARLDAWTFGMGLWMQQAVADHHGSPFNNTGRLDELPERPLFHLGGPSYVLNWVALQGYVYTLRTYDFCKQSRERAEEDVMCATCLLYLGVSRDDTCVDVYNLSAHFIARSQPPQQILPFDTRTMNGSEPFNTFNPDQLVNRIVKGKPLKELSWYQIKTFDMKYGLECCPKKGTISFHYMPVDASVLAHAYLEQHRYT